MIQPLAGSHHLVAGGAGFVGVNLCRRLHAQGAKVSVADNFSRGRREWIEQVSQDIAVYEADLSDSTACAQVFAKIETHTPIDDVWHLAANSDIAAGVADPQIDLRDTFLTTFHILTQMRALKLSNLHFASTSAVYGEALVGAPLRETDCTQPISNYGAMKLASEAQIRAYVESDPIKANIFRFPNVVGAPATHGVIFDFIHKLKSDPSTLAVLGDGSQKKPYLHVDELIDAMIFIRAHSTQRTNVYNIGPQDDGVLVREIATLVRDHVAPEAQIIFGKGNRGWVGDVPKFLYCVSALQALGWAPKLSSAQAIAKTIPMVAHDLALSELRP